VRTGTYFNTNSKINTTTFDLLKQVNYFWVQLHSDPAWLLITFCFGC